MDYCEIVLKGRLVQNPEVKVTQKTGTHVCTFCIASNKKYTTQKTNFYNCVAWSSVADGMTRFKKGQTVRIRGDGDFEEYTNKNGEKAKSFTITVQEIMWDSDYAEENKKVAERQKTEDFKKASDVYKDEDAPAADSDFEEAGDEDDDLPF